MKRALTALALCLALSGCTASSAAKGKMDEQGRISGTFTGTGQGKQGEIKVDVMIDIHVPEEELVRRILLRGKDSGRADDASEEVIRGRLDVYREQTAVVADYYAAQGKYASVNGTGPMEEVFSRIAAVIEGLK